MAIFYDIYMIFYRLLSPSTFETNWGGTWPPLYFENIMLYGFLICTFYLILIFTCQKLMKNRQAFDLSLPLACWNLFLSIFSLIGCFRTVPFLLYTIKKNGFYYSLCSEAISHYGNGSVGFWVTLFIGSKLPELFDTFFIILRKKPLIFLHWYHHVTVLLFCWHSYAHSSSNGIYFAAMNYTVHAIMYFYYFLTALRYRPSWALLVTILQISQMVIGLIVCLSNIWYFYKKKSCSVTSSNLIMGTLMYLSYFGLFMKFFIQRYLLNYRNKLKKI